MTIRNTRRSPGAFVRPITVVEAIIKGVSSAVVMPASVKLPAIIFHLEGETVPSHIREGDELATSVMLTGGTKEYANAWAKALGLYLEDPYIESNFELVSPPAVEVRSYQKLKVEFLALHPTEELCVEFLQPLPFTHSPDKPRTYLSREAFIRMFERRFSRLFNREFEYNYPNDKWDILPYYWHYSENRHHSSSQPGATQFINGCVGKLYIKGDIESFLPWLILGSELHTGSKLSNSQGDYRILPAAPPFFGSKLTDPDALAAVIRDSLETYDEVASALTDPIADSLDEASLAHTLATQINEAAYAFTPNQAFVLEKGTKSRTVEKLHFRDLVVDRHLARMLTPVLDNMFESTSLGFRRGFGRDKAVGMVRAALADGHRCVVKADIEDFFPSVDLGILKSQLEQCLPAADIKLKSLLFAALDNGYVLNGTNFPRTQGLSQGSPLSPLLANLYLDGFDEHIRSQGIVMIRYADDFLIFAKSAAEASRFLSQTRKLLEQLSLRLNDDKTIVASAGEEFSFLGAQFNGPKGDQTTADVFIHTLRKPLYVMQPYVYLAAAGDTVEVRHQGSLIISLPLRRISEIIVMGQATISTVLLRRCAIQGIPLAVTLDSGYYVATIKPDSKSYYELMSRHNQAYSTLSSTEKLSLAKGFAAGKLENFNGLLGQRPTPESRETMDELRRYVADIWEASDIFRVRGLEGAASKLLFRQLNAFVDNEAFVFTRRMKRQPDRINSLYNFGFYLLFTHLNTTLRAMGLNPYLGFLHAPSDNYESLVCDLEELFRARVARLVVRCINLKIIAAADFTHTTLGWRLSHATAKKFVEQFEAELNSRSSKDRLTLRDSMYAQVLNLKSWALTGQSIEFYRWQTR
jgi:CRISPR-associated endonuclease Cas1